MPQLHLYVVGRKPDDSGWPALVWGHLRQTQEYAAVEVDRLKEELQGYLGSDFIPSQE